MKNQFVLLVLILTGVFTQVTYAQEQQGTLADATQMIAAEASVTRDAVANMLQRMEDQSVQIEFNARDYRVKTVEFRQNVSAVLQAFEHQLQTSILRKLSYWANRYNSIYRSTTMSAEQKTQVLTQQLEVIRGQVVLIEQEYHQALRAAYQAVGDLPLTVNFNWVSDPSFRDRRANGCTGASGRQGHGYIVFTYVSPESSRTVSAHACVNRHNEFWAGELSRELNSRSRQLNPGYIDTHLNNSSAYNVLSSFVGETQIFQELVYPVLQQGCRSQICLALSASDLTTYLSLVRTSLDREISVPLDGLDPTPGISDEYRQRISLKLRPLAPTGYYEDISTGMLQMVNGVNALQHLLSLVSYPAQAQSLPFDTE